MWPPSIGVEDEGSVGPLCLPSAFRRKAQWLLKARKRARVGHSGLMDLNWWVEVQRGSGRRLSRFTDWGLSDTSFTPNSSWWSCATSVRKWKGCKLKAECAGRQKGLGGDAEVEKDKRCRLWLIRGIPGRTFLFSFFCRFIQAKPRKPIMAVKPLMSPITPQALLPFNSFLQHIAGIRSGFVPAERLSSVPLPACSHRAEGLGFWWIAATYMHFGNPEQRWNVEKKPWRWAICHVESISTRLSGDLSARCIYLILYKI